MSAEELDIELEARPQAAAEARRELERLSATVPRDVLQDLKLMVSELVTNSYRHAGLTPGEAIHLRLGIADDTIRVEVEDHGRFRRAVERRDNGSGMGLKIIERLARRWGMKHNDGTIVWFEMLKTAS